MDEEMGKISFCELIKNDYICSRKLFKIVNAMPKYISFDWFIKKLLRNKGSFVVLEGFLSVLLNVR